MSEFRKSIENIYNKLVNREPFAFSKYADGELKILKGKNIDNGEFAYSSDDSRSKEYRDKLLESFSFNHDKYYIGIGCPCCMGEVDSQWMRTNSKQDEEHITWANVFVNSNYPLFIEHMLPEFSNHKMVFVCNEKAKLDKLPFKVVKDFRVGHNAIINDYKLVEEMKEWIAKEKIENHVFIFSASSVSNYLAHQLFEFNDKNTYIDIGTTINSFIGMDVNRGYLTSYWGKKKGTISKSCIW